jgi:hypothetical protein
MASIQGSAGFSMSAWSAVLQAASKTFEPEFGVEALCAFGFELIGDRSFLNKTLRRLNCLVGVRRSADLPAGFEILYAARLLRYLERRDRALFDTIAGVKIKHLLTAPQIESIMLRRHSPEYECAGSDRIVILSFRSMVSNIWTEYVDDILSRIGMLTTDFSAQRPPRNRFYQLYAMYETLFGHLVPPMTVEQTELKRFLTQTDNSIQRTYDSPADRASHPGMVSYPWEEMVIRRLIVPRMGLIAAAIRSQPGEPIVLTPPSRTGFGGTTTVLSEATYSAASAHIRASYEAFHFADDTSAVDEPDQAREHQPGPGDFGTCYFESVVVQSRASGALGTAARERLAARIAGVLPDRLLGVAVLRSLDISQEYVTCTISGIDVLDEEWSTMIPRLTEVMAGYAGG